MSQDFREATRFLARHPGFTAVIVLTLGLAIGINSTIFSVLHGVLLRPLAYTQPEQLVGLWESNPAQGQERSQVSAATYLDWRQRSRMFKEIGIYRYHGYTLTGAGEPERLVTVDVSPVLFRVLAVTPQLGRTFTDAEENPGDDSRKVGAQLRHVGAPLRAGSAGRRQDAHPGRCDAHDCRGDAARLSVSAERSGGGDLVAAHAQPERARVPAAPDVQRHRPARRRRDTSTRRVRR